MTLWDQAAASYTKARQSGRIVPLDPAELLKHIALLQHWISKEEPSWLPKHCNVFDLNEELLRKTFLLFVIDFNEEKLPLDYYGATDRRPVVSSSEGDAGRTTRQAMPPPGAVHPAWRKAPGWPRVSDPVKQQQAAVSDSVRINTHERSWGELVEHRVVQ
jgi:hypothetical protein